MAVAGRKGSLLAIVGATTHCVVPLVPGGGRARHRVVTEVIHSPRRRGIPERHLLYEAPAARPDAHFVQRRRFCSMRTGRSTAPRSRARRFGAVRARKGCLHGRSGAAAGPLRAGRRRHDLPRRGRGAAAAGAGRPAARPPGAREFERVGGSETLRTDARVVAATNRNLVAREGKSRADLFFRLNVFRSVSHRCANGPRTSRSSPSTGAGTRSNSGSRSARSMRQPWPRSPRMPGRATSASCRTSSSARSSSLGKRPRPLDFELPASVPTLLAPDTVAPAMSASRSKRRWRPAATECRRRGRRGDPPPPRAPPISEKAPDADHEGSTEFGLLAGERRRISR